MTDDFCERLNDFARIYNQDSFACVTFTGRLVVAFCRINATKETLYKPELVVCAPERHSTSLEGVHYTKANEVPLATCLRYVLSCCQSVVSSTFAELFRTAYVLQFVATTTTNIPCVYAAFNNLRLLLGVFNRVKLSPVYPEELNSHVAIIGGRI